jgi:hypothetical protein
MYGLHPTISQKLVTTTELSLTTHQRSLFLCYGEFRFRNTMWFRGQSSWLQIQRPGFDSQRYQIFWEVVGLKRGSLSLVSITEELLERKSSGSGLENQGYSHRGSSALTTRHNSTGKFGTNFSDKQRSLGRIVSSRTKTTALLLSCCIFL